MIKQYLVLLVVALLVCVSCKKTKVEKETNTVIVQEGPLKKTSLSEEDIEQLKKQNGIMSLENHYVVFNKEKLGRTFLMGGYLSTSTFPVMELAPLQTKLVTFEQSSNKLYLFDVNPHKRFIQTSEAKILLNAYRIVGETKETLTIDFSEDLNENAFSEQGALLYPVFGNDKLKKVLSMVNSFKYSNGYNTFVNVITLKSDKPLLQESEFIPATQDLYTVTLKLNYFLKEYEQNKNFTPKRPISGVGYFVTDPLLVTTKTQVGIHETVVKYIYKWDTEKKHNWYYSPNWPKYLVPALHDSIAAWNKLLGKEVFILKEAPADLDPHAPDVNYMFWSETEALALVVAYASLITDPLSGEILNGKIVFFGSSFLNFHKENFVINHPQLFTAKENPASLGKTINKLLSETQNGGLNKSGATALLSANPGILDIYPYEPLLEVNPNAPSSQPALPRTLSWEEYFSRVTAKTMTHEFGHILGLRHNFKGSLVAEPAMPSSKKLQYTSIMDYLPASHSFQNFIPGAYDVMAIDYAYHGKIPTKHFDYCTDEDVNNDPECLLFDVGDPFVYTQTLSNSLVLNPSNLPFVSLEGLYLHVLKPLFNYSTSSNRHKTEALDLYSKMLQLGSGSSRTFPQFQTKYDDIKILQVALLFENYKKVQNWQPQVKIKSFDFLKQLAVDRNNSEIFTLRELIIESLFKTKDVFTNNALREIEKELSAKVLMNSAKLETEKLMDDAQKINTEKSYYLFDLALLNKTRKLIFGQF